MGSALYYGGVLWVPGKSSVCSSWNCQESAEAMTSIRAGLGAESQRFWASPGGLWVEAPPRRGPREAGPARSAPGAGLRAHALGTPGQSVLRGRGWFQLVRRGGAARQILTWAVTAAAGWRAAA